MSDCSFFDPSTPSGIHAIFSLAHEVPLASIGWQDMSITVTVVLIAGCGGLLILARELAHETIVQPMIEPMKRHRVVIRHAKVVHTTRPQEDERSAQDTADTGIEVEVLVLMQAARKGLTGVRIIEELDPHECWCPAPRLDRAYLIKAREYGSICACVNENDPWVSPRVYLFPAE